MSIEVRRFRGLRDRAICAAIFARGWSHAFPHYPRAIDADTFDRETSEETIFVAEDNRAVIGFASLYAAEGFLHHLYVDPPFHRRGAGRALVAAVREAAMAGITLKCSVDNAPALAFYARLGFAETERGADRYGAWVMLSAPSL